MTTSEGTRTVPRHDEQRSNSHAQHAPCPAVGLVADDDPSVLTNVIEALDRGLDPVVLDLSDGESAVAQVAAELGADVFTQPTSSQDEETLRELLQSRATAPGRGVIVSTDTARPIDFEESLEALDGDSSVTEAVYKPDEDVDVLVGIPAYNEAGAIHDVVTASRQYADEVVVVDDASDDDTAIEAVAAGATVVRHEKNRGYGGALQTAFTEAKQRDVNHLVIIDGDGQHDASDIPTAVDSQRETGAEIVIGSRFAAESETDIPTYRRFGLEVINVLTNLSLGSISPRNWVRDTQSGFRVYDSTAVKTLSDDVEIGKGMNASTDILYHAERQNYNMVEIATTIKYDVENPSNHRPIKHGLDVTHNIVARSISGWIKNEKITIGLLAVSTLMLMYSTSTSAPVEGSLSYIGYGIMSANIIVLIKEAIR